MAKLTNEQQIEFFMIKLINREILLKLISINRVLRGKENINSHN